MPAYIEMPKLSDTMTEGTLVKWLKKEGDSVAIDEAIAEIETDKATMEMQSFEDGTLHKIYVEEGTVAPLGAKLALVLLEGEEPPADADTPPDAAPAPAADAEEPAAEEEAEEFVQVPDVEESKSAASPPPAETSAGGRVKASPLARKLAAEKGIDLSTIAGSGPGGRIVKEDVVGTTAGKAAASAPAAKPQPQPAPAPAPAARRAVPSLTGASADRRITLTGMRRLIAERLLESKTTIPHFYLQIEADAAPMMSARKQLNAESELTGGNRYTVNDFVMLAAVKAALAVPAVNASFEGDAVVQFADIHLAVAVAIDQGLVTPVIRSAQNLSFLELSQAMKVLAERARTKKLGPDEMSGGTFTISNLGSYGIAQFDAIINPPQAMILSVGAILNKPVVNDAGAIVAGQRLFIGMSCDHRVIDGAAGAEYLAALRQYLEQPIRMLA